MIIPKEIFSSSPEILLSCVAGIFDAEGSIYFDKRKKYKKPYPIIEIHMNNPLLIKQVSEILKDNNIDNYVRDNFSRLYVYGEKEINNFIDKVEIKNPKHLKKLDNFFKYYV